MHDEELLILGGREVETVLAGREAEILAAVAAAYRTHGRGDSSLPHSTFLRFPDDDRNRIIALPAFLGGEHRLAGMKWIASFPGNVAQGRARASAVLILNDAATGYAQAILESSIISARRTAASAALAARELLAGRPARVAGLVGTGVINFETARFLLAAVPSLERFVVFDLNAERAAQAAAKLSGSFGRPAEVAPDVETLYRRSPLISFATTAVRPHVTDLSACAPGTVILHVSLRDLAPELILAADNVVDDVDHVSRAQTSIHLAEQLRGGDRSFIRATLAELLEGTAPPKPDAGEISIFSPFGLGILDLAVGQVALNLAREQGLGTVIPSFLPDAAAV
jgi:2,3-diaminopropionate biosynthesis protein SbnB